MPTASPEDTAHGSTGPLVWVHGKCNYTCAHWRHMANTVERCSLVPDIGYTAAAPQMQM